MNDHTRWLNESDDIDAIRREQREQDARWNSPEDFDPVAAANQRIMDDLGKALDKALPTTNTTTYSASEPTTDATDLLAQMKAAKDLLPPPPWYDSVAVSAVAFSELFKSAAPEAKLSPFVCGVRLEREPLLPPGYTLQKLGGKIVGVNFRKVPSDIHPGLDWTPGSAVYWLKHFSDDLSPRDPGDETGE